ncbi:MAG: hypothetical protein OFPII_10300 [Osedax symbiont Rs1]|nr:MAG: hypothetical protein OFPII_10300 [Osedax symbiont Rs1]
MVNQDFKEFSTTEVTEALRCTEKTLKSRNLERQKISRP